MICSRKSIALALFVLLAGCAQFSAGEATPSTDWREMLRAGDGVGAEIVLRRRLAGGAQKAELAPFLGEAAMLQGNVADAHKWLNQGDFTPQVAAHGFHMLGRLRMLEGDLPAAGQALDRALALRADDSELWVDIGRLRYRGGEQAQAVSAAQHALKLGPNNPAALLFAAQLTRDAEGARAALPLFERGLAAAPRNAALLSEYAGTLGELGRAADSLAAIRQLANVDPGNPRVMFLQAVIAARAGRLDLARSLLQRSGNLDRKMPAAILLLALIDLDNHNYASAAQGFDSILAAQPDNFRVRNLLARALLLSGHERELVARFATADMDPYLAELVGRAYEAIGDRDRAAPFLAIAETARADTIATKALGSSRVMDGIANNGLTSGRDTVALVRGLIADGDPAAALRSAQAFLARHRGSADALALAGDAALASADPRTALDYYRRAAAIRRPWPLAKRMIAAFDQVGDRQGAVSLLEAVAASEPNNAEAADWLAWHRDAP